MKLNAIAKSMFKFDGRLSRGVAAVLASLTLGTVVTVALVSLSYSSNAQACRDCPFPMKTSDNHWLMPNGLIEVSIVQHQRRDGKIETKIELHSAKTGELLASGTVITPRGQTNVSTQLADPQGNQVQFEVVWYDDQHERVQIDMHCMSNACAIDSFMDGI